MTMNSLRRRKRISHLVFLFFVWPVKVQLSLERDTPSPSNVFSESEYLVSPNKLFWSMFFNPENSSNRYLGIQHMHTEMKIIWVANRENPFIDIDGYSHCFLNITEDGNLVLSDGNATSITINSESPAPSSNTSATRLNTGNFVLRAEEEVVWQSFDYPTDTILPGMKLGLFDQNLKQNKTRKYFLTSWDGPGHPASRIFTLGIDPNNTDQLVIWRRDIPYRHSGKWNGKTFSNFHNIKNYDGIQFSYIPNRSESYFAYNVHTHYSSSWI